MECVVRSGKMVNHGLGDDEELEITPSECLKWRDKLLELADKMSEDEEYNMFLTASFLMHEKFLSLTEDFLEN